jgi:hypothetical protein
MIAGRVGERWLGATRNEAPSATADIRASGRVGRHRVGCQRAGASPEHSCLVATECCAR